MAVEMEHRLVRSSTEILRPALLSNTRLKSRRPANNHTYVNAPPSISHCSKYSRKVGSLTITNRAQVLLLLRRSLVQRLSLRLCFIVGHILNAASFHLPKMPENDNHATENKDAYGHAEEQQKAFIPKILHIVRIDVEGVHQCHRRC